MGVNLFEEAAKAERIARYAAKPESSVVVIENQDVISAFLASRDLGKEAGKVRAILVEFVKFSATKEPK